MREAFDTKGGKAPTRHRSRPTNEVQVSITLDPDKIHIESGASVSYYYRITRTLPPRRLLNNIANGGYNHAAYPLGDDASFYYISHTGKLGDGLHGIKESGIAYDYVPGSENGVYTLSALIDREVMVPAFQAGSQVNNTYVSAWFNDWAGGDIRYGWSDPQDLYGPPMVSYVFPAEVIPDDVLPPSSDWAGQSWYTDPAYAFVYNHNGDWQQTNYIRYGWNYRYIVGTRLNGVYTDWLVVVPNSVPNANYFLNGPINNPIKSTAQQIAIQQGMDPRNDGNSGGIGGPIGGGGADPFPEFRAAWYAEYNTLNIPRERRWRKSHSDADFNALLEGVMPDHIAKAIKDAHPQTMLAKSAGNLVVKVEDTEDGEWPWEVLAYPYFYNQNEAATYAKTLTKTVTITYDGTPSEDGEIPRIEATATGTCVVTFYRHALQAYPDGPATAQGFWTVKVEFFGYPGIRNNNGDCISLSNVIPAASQCNGFWGATIYSARAIPTNNGCPFRRNDREVFPILTGTMYMMISLPNYLNINLQWGSNKSFMPLSDFRTAFGPIINPPLQYEALLLEDSVWGWTMLAYWGPVNHYWNPAFGPIYGYRYPEYEWPFMFVDVPGVTSTAMEGYSAYRAQHPYIDTVVGGEEEEGGGPLQDAYVDSAPATSTNFRLYLVEIWHNEHGNLGMYPRSEDYINVYEYGVKTKAEGDKCKAVCEACVDYHYDFSTGKFTFLREVGIGRLPTFATAHLENPTYLPRGEFPTYHWSFAGITVRSNCRTPRDVKIYFEDQYEHFYGTGGKEVGYLGGADGLLDPTIKTMVNNVPVEWWLSLEEAEQNLPDGVDGDLWGDSVWGWFIWTLPEFIGRYNPTFFK